MKRLLILFLLLLCGTALAQQGTTLNVFTSKFDYCLNVKEEDGDPSNMICGPIKVTNGTLTDNGDGSYSLTTGGGGGGGSGTTIDVQDSGAAVVSSSTISFNDNLVATNSGGDAQVTIADVYVLTAGDTLTGTLVLDDTSIEIQEGANHLSITVPVLTADRTTTFPDAGGEISLLGNSIDPSELLDSHDPPGDEEVLTYESTGTKFEWQVDDDVPDAGDFGAATDLDANGEVADDSHNHVYSNIDAFTEANLYTILSDVVQFYESGDIIDINTATNLVAGTSITLTGNTLDVDDDFLKIAGDVSGAGAFDFGGASDFEIPQDKTVNADGEITVDGTTGQFRYHDGTAQRVLVYEHTACGTIENPTTADDNIPFLIAPAAITITAVGCNVSASAGTLDFEDAGDTAVDAAAVTCGVNTATWDESMGGTATLTKGEILEVDVDGVSSSPSWIQGCVRYTIDAD